MSNNEIPKGLKEHLFCLYAHASVPVYTKNSYGILSLKTVGDCLLYGIGNRWIELRALSSINLYDAVQILKTFGRFYPHLNYVIRYRVNTFGEKFAQLYYIDNDGKDQIAANFGIDGTFHAVNSNRGEVYFAAHLHAIQLGYASPIYYNGQLFSVEQLTQLEHIVIKP